MSGPDVLRWFDTELAEARESLARLVDRTSALAEMRSVALEVADRLGIHELSVVELFGAELAEQDRARLVALARRVAIENAADAAITEKGTP